MSKICRACSIEKPYSEFYPDIRYADNYVNWCKPCHIERCRSTPEKQQEQRWKRRYGISRPDVELLELEQNGRCAVCKKREWAVIDHDHATGEVRGLLCHACNRALGILEPHLSRVDDYLGRV